MAKPTVRVRVAFGDGPYVDPPTYTDVTAYVRSVNTSRGRTDDWQNFDSGNATVVFDNRDRRFDPTHASGPYYGNLLPRRQIRIDATVDSVTYYNIFRGFIDGWPVNLTDAGYDSTVTVNCYDALGLLSQDKCPDNWSDNYIQTLTPTHYWKLDDTINPANIPTTAGTVTNLQLKDYGSAATNLYAELPSTPTANSDSLARGIPARTVIWPNQARYITTASTTDYTSGAGCFWFVAPDADMTFYHEGNTGNRFLSFSYSRTSNVLSGMFKQGTGTGTLTGRFFTIEARLTAGTSHHIAFSWTGTNYTDFALTLLIDGVLVSPTFSNVGGQNQGANLFQIYGAQQQIVTWSGTTRTEAQLRTIFQLGNNVLTESTSARFDRIRATTPFSGALCDTPVYPAGTVADLTPGGAFVKAELQLTADSEGGELYVNKSGRLVMTSRTYFQEGNSLTNQATFGAGGIPIGTEMSYYWSADNIRNTLEIGWAGDATYRVEDSDSVTAYGVCQDSYDTSLSTLADVTDLGSYLVGYGKLPRLIMSAVELGQALSTSQWATVLGLELLDRITVVVPEPTGSNLSQKQLVQQIEHEITPGDWRTRILGSSRWSSYFILDESLLDGTDLLA